MDCSSFSNSSVRVKGRADEVLARPAILESEGIRKLECSLWSVAFFLLPLRWRTRRDFALSTGAKAWHSLRFNTTLGRFRTSHLGRMSFVLARPRRLESALVSSRIANFDEQLQCNATYQCTPTFSPQSVPHKYSKSCRSMPPTSSPLGRID
jgi:hypothetical protein